MLDHSQKQEARQRQTIVDMVRLDVSNAIGYKLTQLQVIPPVNSNRWLVKVAAPNRWDFFAKIFEEDAPYYRELQCLQHIGGMDAPRLIYANDSNRLLLTEYVPSQAVSTVIRHCKKIKNEDLLAQCAMAYGRLLKLPTGYIPRSHAELLEEFRPIVDRSFPKTNLPESQYIVDVLNRQPFVGCHRDFHTENVLLAKDGRIISVDFEAYGLDAPVVDIARFCFNPALHLQLPQRLDIAKKFIQVIRENTEMQLSLAEVSIACSYWAICCVGYYLIYHPLEVGPQGKYHQLASQPIYLSLALEKELLQ